MAFTKNQIIMIGIGVLLFLFIVLLFMGVVPGLRSTETPDISGTLNVWGVYDRVSAFEPLIAEYNKIHPGVAVKYQQMDPLTYESDLIDALAAGKGPDIYMIKNTWLPKQFDKLSSLTETQFPHSRLEQAFPKVVLEDFSFTSSTISALPLYLDTLVLYYNKDLFDNAGLANPPATWEELESVVPLLRSIDATQKILRAAIALGGSNQSMAHAPDILSLLMLQKGVKMIEDDRSEAKFAAAGDKWFKYYLEFANPISPLYTWNNSVGQDLELFAKGELAMFIGYRSDADSIREKNAFLRFGAAPMFQWAGEALKTNYASYWGLAVANTSPLASIAWDFIGTVTLNQDIIAGYLTAADRLPALRTMIAGLAQDQERAYLAQQLLTASSWSQVDSAAIDRIFSSMIEQVLTGKTSRDKALRAAEVEITELMRRRLRTTE